MLLSAVGGQRMPTEKPMVRTLDGAPPQVRIGGQTFRSDV